MHHVGHAQSGQAYHHYSKIFFWPGPEEWKFTPISNVCIPDLLRFSQAQCTQLGCIRSSAGNNHGDAATKGRCKGTVEALKEVEKKGGGVCVSEGMYLKRQQPSIGASSVW